MNKRTKVLIGILGLVLVFSLVNSGVKNNFGRITPAQYNTMGFNADHSNKKLLARRYFKKGLKAAKYQKTDELMVARLGFNLGTIYTYFGKDEKAAEQYIKAVELYKKALREQMTPYSSKDYYIYTAAHYMYARTKETPDEKIDAYEETIDIAELTGYSAIKSKAINAIAKTYYKEKNYEQVDELANEIINDENTKDDDLASAYNIKAVLAIHKEDYNEAEKYFMDAIKIYESYFNRQDYGKSEMLPFSYGTIAFVQLKKGNCDKAKAYFEKAGEAHSKIKNYKFPPKHHPDIDACNFNINYEGFIKYGI